MFKRNISVIFKFVVYSVIFNCVVLVIEIRAPCFPRAAARLHLGELRWGLRCLCRVRGEQGEGKGSGENEGKGTCGRPP